MDRRRFLILSSQGAALCAVPALVGCARETASDGPGTTPEVELDSIAVDHVVDDRILVFGDDGAAYALDATGHRVHRVDAAGASSSESFGTLGHDSGELNHPVDGAVAPDGSLYLVDRGNDRVVHYGPDGEPVGMLGRGELRSPSDLTIHDGSVFVCDTLNHRVVRFDLAGAVIGTIEGKGDRALNGPRSVACGDDRVYVVDGGDASVAVVRDGAVVARLGGYGEEPGRFLRPATVAHGADGRLFVGDVASGFVSVFDGDDGYLGRFRPRDADGAPAVPAQLHVLPDGTLHVSTTGHASFEGA